MKKIFESYDFVILFSVLFLISVSLIGIYSATINESSSYIKKQVIFAILSLIIIFSLPFLDYRKIVNNSIWLYILGILSLIYVKFFGITVLGAKRWIKLGFFSLQPSEFMKYIVVIFVAYILAVAKIPISYKDVAKILIVVSIPFYLTLKQPDLGTAITILIPILFIIFLAGLDKKFIIGSFLIIIFSSPFIWMHLKDYQKNRIIAFIKPEADPYGTAYHIIQSKIAVGSGKLVGKGFLQGTQSKLLFLPEKHTDFIFATLSEEFGFVLSAIIVLVFLLLALRILYWGSKVKDKAGKFICYGFGGLIATQAFINIAMTIGFAPVVGITLPFISYGGSSLITFSLMVGTVLSVIRINKMQKLQFTGD
ncbi:rod shape-determining protein RodA [Hydrogenothermus marinus]|uniref:Peptidoglycan glycosyltransferase RodA n=1 Tax=Hydrogenothermus marinus TaxID=133270 RepID=A0A3M0B6S9_9AQUI|nr:rod shape-determining protein RodA [Hydrogenothermus marinus]RMA93073.1 rod shape determining protein RodA [Hydrogenothermus marinus]